ncbi:unnamed protein product [Miscanthus lutarioriparius]|uniref:Uncharacterized protein n=1 Tax=Miscanthus lutarioriparius TaxID=422564 RepID=A0A811NNJ0_9POAL|nr:unnamed protein product [Miscanthus lutarioriparius]
MGWMCRPLLRGVRARRGPAIITAAGYQFLMGWMCRPLLRGVRARRGPGRRGPGHRQGRMATRRECRPPARAFCSPWPCPCSSRPLGVIDRARLLGAAGLVPHSRLRQQRRADGRCLPTRPAGYAVKSELDLLVSEYAVKSELDLFMCAEC